MQPTPSLSRRTNARDERDRSGGFTIIELLIACSLLLIVLGVIAASLDQVVMAESYTSDRTNSLDAMRLTLNRMTREIRQASSIDEPVSTPSRMEFDTYGSTGARHVVYNAVGTVLTRQVNSGSAVKVLSGLASTNIFTYVTAPPVPGAQWVLINLRVRPKRSPETILVLDSEINLRNRTGVSS
jgi:type II secretory pathway component PulJ